MGVFVMKYRKDVRDILLPLIFLNFLVQISESSWDRHMYMNIKNNTQIAESKSTKNTNSNSLFSCLTQCSMTPECCAASYGPGTLCRLEMSVHCSFSVSVNQGVTLAMTESVNQSLTPAMTELIIHSSTLAMAESVSQSSTPPMTELVNHSTTLAMTESVIFYQSSTLAMTESVNQSSTPVMTESVNQSSTLTMTESVNQSSTLAMTELVNHSSTLAMTESVNQSSTPAMTESVNQSSTPAMTESVNQSSTLAMTESVNQSSTPAMTESVNQSSTLAMTESVNQSSTPAMTESVNQSSTLAMTESVNQSSTPAMAESANQSSTLAMTESVNQSSTPAMTESVNQSSTLAMTESVNQSSTPAMAESANQSSTLATTNTTLSTLCLQHKVILTTVNFTEAIEACSNWDMKLTVIKNSTTYNKVLTYLNNEQISTDVWIGMVWDGTLEQFRWTDDNAVVTEPIQWTSLEPNCMTPWTTPCDPNHGNPFQNCVRLRFDGTYRTHNCYKKYLPLCQTTFLSDDTSIRYIAILTLVPYDTAVQLCSDLGMELAVIKDNQTYDNVIAYINKEAILDPVWIGMVWENTAQEFRWTDNNDVLSERIPWHYDNEPNHMAPTNPIQGYPYQNCVRLVYGFFRTSDCTYIYMCHCVKKPIQ